MIVAKLPHLTPAQQKREDLQVQWLISALAKLNEARPAKLDESTLQRRRCPTCGSMLKMAR